MAKIHRMKKKFLKLKELKKSWWWRERDYRNPRKRFGCSEIPFHNPDRGIDRVAHNYELMRRCPEAKELNKTFLEIDRDTGSIIHVLWAQKLEFPYRMAIDQDSANERGWTVPDPRLQWNLRLPPGTSSKQFLHYLKSFQAVQKIRPKRHLTGKRNRGVSWREIEILDRNQNHIGNLNESERHTASSALKKAFQLFGEFKRGVLKHNKRVKSLYDFDAIADSDSPDDF